MSTVIFKKVWAAWTCFWDESSIAQDNVDLKNEAMVMTSCLIFLQLLLYDRFFSFSLNSYVTTVNRIITKLNMYLSFDIVW